MLAALQQSLSLMRYGCGWLFVFVDKQSSYLISGRAFSAQPNFPLPTMSSEPSKPSETTLSTNNASVQPDIKKNKTDELLNVLTGAGNLKKSKRYLIYNCIYNCSPQLIPIELMTTEAIQWRSTELREKKLSRFSIHLRSQQKHSLLVFSTTRGARLTIPCKLQLSNLRNIHASFIRDPRVIQQHLDFYNGILKFVPSLRNSLDTMSPEQLLKIIQAVRICAYMHNC